MTATYFAWSVLVHDEQAQISYASLDHIGNYDKAYRLYKGDPLRGELPPDAFFPMDPAHPKEIRLADNVANLHNSLVVSDRLKAFMEAQEPPDVEYLPITIRDHKGRAVEDGYHLINPLRVVDAIDQEASEIVWNRINKNRISVCKRLVLNYDAIDEHLLLFRLRHRPDVWP
ncbi:MAG: DUF1629 domain-containing protein, partial [Bacteroidota bacterium]